MTEIGHNSGEIQIGGIAAETLRAFVSRIEALEAEKKALSADIQDVYGQAKSHGFETKIIRKLIALRRMDDSEREKADQLLDLYKNALGML